jgi:hypothetical protein
MPAATSRRVAPTTRPGWLLVSPVPAVIVETSVLDGQRIHAISYLEPEESWDSGFAIWSSPPDAGAGGSYGVCVIDVPTSPCDGVDSRSV